MQQNHKETCAAFRISITIPIYLDQTVGYVFVPVNDF